MRLVKFVQFAVWMAAAGGGAAVVLSGSALAATEVSSASTISQNNAVRTTTVDRRQITGTTSNGGSVSRSESVTNATTGDATSSVSDNGTTDASDTANASGAKATPTKTQTQQTNNTADQGAPVSSTTKQFSNLTSDGSVTQPSSSAGQAAGTSQSAPPPSQQPAATTNLVSASQLDEVAVETPVTAVVRDQASLVSPNVYRKTVMPIQPTITNRLPQTEDLAPMAPSAPGPARAPRPAKSNGMLGGLTAELAAITVPQPALLHALAVPRAIFALSLLGLVVLFTEAFVSSYGLWLRRGGFATAARSDEPTIEGTSFLATPFWLGYVELPPRLHSPIFMAVDSFLNALGKEETR